MSNSRLDLRAERADTRDMTADNRLTGEDRNVIHGRLAEIVASWRDHTPRYEDIPALERLGHHAIGCTIHDLRDAELDEIRAMALAAANLKDFR
jgi:hypothetical protein